MPFLNLHRFASRTSSSLLRRSLSLSSWTRICIPTESPRRPRRPCQRRYFASSTARSLIKLFLVGNTKCDLCRTTRTSRSGCYSKRQLAFDKARIACPTSSLSTTSRFRRSASELVRQPNSNSTTARPSRFIRNREVDFRLPAIMICVFCLRPPSRRMGRCSRERTSELASFHN